MLRAFNNRTVRNMTLTSPDIDQAIAEFRAAIGDLFATHERAEIELLKTRIAERERHHQPTVILRKELLEKMTKQLQRELA